MADTPEKRMVQTVLNFQSPRTTASPNRRPPPAFIKRAQSDVDMLRAETDVNSQDAEESRSQAMEDVQSTQTTTISWPSTTTSTSSRSKVDESLHRLDRMELRRKLAEAARETTRLLPGLLSTTPHAPPKGFLYAPPHPPSLNRKFCPKLTPTAIRVHDADSFDTAIGLAQCEKYITVRDKQPVCVLNMANAFTAGGGWKNGALAQEEALCYRSSLSFTLKLRYYPIPEFGAIYSPTVIIIRKSMREDHELYPLDKPEDFPVVSVISVAAIDQPKVNAGVTVVGSQEVYRERYADPADRETMKEKMRVILRAAAYNGHRRLVLGALGCGAFANPREEVADCWAEVFTEAEFTGGWWESVIFAVMDDLGGGETGEGNFGVFFRRLNGMTV